MVRLQFPKDPPNNWQAKLSIALTICVCAGYFFVVLISVVNQDPDLFQNAGAVGVAAVLATFASFRRKEQRQIAFENFSIATATSDMMVLRYYAHNEAGKEQLHEAGERVKEALDYFDQTQRKSDTSLLLEVMLSVFFTLQWGFGKPVFNRLLLCGEWQCS